MSKLIKVTVGLAGGILSTAAFGTAAQAGCTVAPPPPPACVKCDGPRTGTSTLPPLSSYFQHQARCGGHVYRPPVTHPAPTRPHHPPAQASSHARASAHASASAHATASRHASASAYAHASASGQTSASATANAYAGSYSGTASASASANANAYSGSYAESGAQASATATANATPIVNSTYQSHQYGYQSFSGTYDGLGKNERLHPTHCPVKVYNPGHKQVQGCYKVVKEWTPPQIQRPVPHRVYYRVVRPIIYVRYPVPVCVSNPCVPVPHYRSRYGA